METTKLWSKILFMVFWIGHYDWALRPPCEVCGRTTQAYLSFNLDCIPSDNF